MYRQVLTVLAFCRVDRAPAVLERSEAMLEMRVAWSRHVRLVVNRLFDVVLALGHCHSACMWMEACGSLARDGVVVLCVLRLRCARCRQIFLVVHRLLDIVLLNKAIEW